MTLDARETMPGFAKPFGKRRKIRGDAGQVDATCPPTDTLLTGVPAGRTVRVAGVNGGYRLLDRLSALGVVPGAAARILRNPRCGPLLLQVHDTRVALGRGQAAKVRVAPLPDAAEAADDAG
mgnify:FL=1